MKSQWQSMTTEKMKTKTKPRTRNTIFCTKSDHNINSTLNTLNKTS